MIGAAFGLKANLVMNQSVVVNEEEPENVCSELRPKLVIAQAWYLLAKCETNV